MLEPKAIVLRYPSAEDGAQLFQLIEQCPPLDMNSMYCNLLQCSHFAGTSIAAEQEGCLVGFVSGYIKPSDPSTLFIWQVAVGEKARGQGLARKMVMALLQRPECIAVNKIETTITPDNEASWGLFTSIAKNRQAELKKSVMFDQHKHFAGVHQTEYLVQIGPFKAAS